MTTDLRKTLEGLSEEEAARWLSEQIGKSVVDAFAAPPKPLTAEQISAYWDLTKRMGPSPEMREMIQGGLDRGVRFYHPDAETEEDEGYELRTVKAIWDACCDTNGRMSAVDPTPMKHIVVKLDCETGVLLDGEDPE